MLPRKFPFLIILILLGLFIAANSVFAAWEVTWPEIPGTDFVKGSRCPASGCPPADLPGFVAYLFTLALVSAGIVALGTLVWGAIQFVASAGFPSMRSEARNRMTGAVAGLLLLLATYIILNTINPELVMPGLGLAPGVFLAPAIDSIEGVIREGVVLYVSDTCDTSEHWARYTQAQVKLDDHMNNKAKAFKMLDEGVVVNFFDNENFSGLQLSVEGPTGDCVKLSDYDQNSTSTLTLTERISSLNFEQWLPGVTLCKYARPSQKEGDCDYLSYTQGAYPEKVTYGQGSVNSPSITTSSPAYYDLQNPPRAVAANQAKWIGVAPGYYGVLCADRDTNSVSDDDHCFYLLETTHLGLYGDRFICPGCTLCDEVETVVIEKSQDKYCGAKSDCRSCKGVIFYTNSYFNRQVFGWPLLSAETASWPIGLGDISNGAVDPRLDINTYNFTKMADVWNPDEINNGGAVPPDTPHISSLKLIGNCKLKVFDGVNYGGANNFVFTKTEKDLNLITRGLGPATWDEAIQSFILCNANDMIGDCSF